MSSICRTCWTNGPAKMRSASSFPSPIPMWCTTVRSARSRLVYVPQDMDAQALRERIKTLPGIEKVLSRQEASVKFELPSDRIGDIVVVSDQNTVIHRREAPRPVGTGCTAAIARRCVGTESAAVGQSRGQRGLCRSPLAQLRRLRPGPEPRPPTLAFRKIHDRRTCREHSAVIHESLRIAGEKVARDRRITVTLPTPAT